MCPTVLCDPSQLDHPDPLPNRSAACEATTALAVTPDLAVVAVATRTSWAPRLGELLVARPSRGVVTRLRLPSLAGGAVVRDVGFNGDGNKLVAVVHGRDAEAMVCCWDRTETLLWTHLWSYRAASLPGMDFGSVCFSRDGRRVAAASDRTGDVAVWDVESGRVLYECKAVSSAAVALDASGDRVAHLVKTSACGPGQQIAIAEVGSGACARWPVALSWVNGLSFAPESDALAVVGERVGGTAAAIVRTEATDPVRLRLTSAIQPEPPQALHPVWINSGVRVALVCHDGAMVWDIERDAALTIAGESQPGATVALTPCGDQLVMASPDGVSLQALPAGGKSR